MQHLHKPVKHVPRACLNRQNLEKTLLPEYVILQQEFQLPGESHLLKLLLQHNQPVMRVQNTEIQNMIFIVRCTSHIVAVRRSPEFL